LSELQNASVILKELFATEESFSIENIQIPRQSKKSFSVGMTICLCHSEGAFRDWRIILYRKHTDSSSKQKKLFCRNDNTSLSFWRSFLRLKNLSFFENIKVPCWKKKIPRQSKNSFSVGMTIRLCLFEGAFCDWRIFPFSKTLKFLAERKDSSSKKKRLLCRKDKNIPNRRKRASLSEWQYVFVILKELFATEESFLFRKH
jgi:hypothetical protein